TFDFSSRYAGTSRTWGPAPNEIAEEGNQLVWRELERTFDTRSIPASSPVSITYDPTLAIYGGRNLAAFECHGAATGPSAGICLTEVDKNGHLLRAPLVVVKATTVGSEVLSASVPKLFVHRGQLWLAWT